MKKGKVSLGAAPKFLRRFSQGRAEPGPASCAESGGPPVVKFKAARGLTKVVGWMLLGLIIASSDLPRVHSQDSRVPRADNTKSKALLAGREATSAKDSTKFSSPQKTVQPDIVLPDIYIPVPAKISDPVAQSYSPIDTTIFKPQLQQSAVELESLRNERDRLVKTMEPFKTRSAKALSERPDSKGNY